MVLPLEGFSFLHALYIENGRHKLTKTVIITKFVKLAIHTITSRDSKDTGSTF